MIREERIDWLCRLRADLNNGVIFTPWNKEFTEALTGILEQEPCEDAISRQDAIKAIDEKAKRIKNEDTLNGLAGAVGILFDLPPVKPQEKTGHWQHYEGMLICSECGAEFYDDIMEYCGDDVPKCCPDCGIRMVEEQERIDKG